MLLILNNCLNTHKDYRKADAIFYVQAMHNIRFSNIVAYDFVC